MQKTVPKAVEFTVVQAAAMLGLTVQRLYQMAGAGELTLHSSPVVKQEKRVSKNELNRLIVDRAAQKAAKAPKEPAGRLI
jgi:hypothetical protein